MNRVRDGVGEGTWSGAEGPGRGKERKDKKMDV